MFLPMRNEYDGEEYEDEEDEAPHSLDPSGDTALTGSEQDIRPINAPWYDLSIGSAKPCSFYRNCTLA
jgi:hypothetical protein